MLHPRTSVVLESVAQHMPQGIMLHAPEGISFQDAVESLQTKSVTVEYVLPEKQEVVNRDEGAITIAVIRRLYELTKTRALNPRYIVIEKADSMSTQAQNAFLKLLEEPNATIHFILLVREPQRLLPTVHSRVQQLDILPLTREQSEQVLDSLHILDHTKRAQILFLAEGLSEYMKQLASDEDYFSAATKRIIDARTVLQNDTYQSLKIIHAYKDNRQAALGLLEAILKLLQLSLKKQSDERTLHRLQQFLQAHEAITQNGNIRLQLTTAVL